MLNGEEYVKSFSSKENQIWLLKGKRTKAKGNNKKRQSLIQRKNEERKEKREMNK